jgi:hypothetical protein
MKFRIISETKSNTTVYKIQYKYFFKWHTLAEQKLSFVGELLPEYHLIFDTQKDAEDYIEENYLKPTKKVLKEFNI